MILGFASEGRNPGPKDSCFAGVIHQRFRKIRIREEIPGLDLMGSSSEELGEARARNALEEVKSVLRNRNRASFETPVRLRPSLLGLFFCRSFSPFPSPFPARASLRLLLLPQGVGPLPLQKAPAWTPKIPLRTRCCKQGARPVQIALPEIDFPPFGGMASSRYFFL